MSFFKKKKQTQKQQVIGKEAILEAYIDTGIYIQKGSRCCTKHFLENSKMLSEQALQELRSVNESVSLKEIECTELIESLKTYAKNNSIFDKFKFPRQIPNDLCFKNDWA